MIIQLFVVGLMLGCAEPNEIDMRPIVENGIIGGSIVSKDSQIARMAVYIGVAFFNNGKSVAENNCTGVLVSSKVVLTAAHCFFNNDIEFDSKKVYVAFGSDLKQSSDLVVWFAQDAFMHPEYKYLQKGSNRVDLAVVVLPKSAPMPFAPAKILQDFSKLSESLSVTVAGYGLVSLFPKVPSANLKSTASKILEIRKDMMVIGAEVDNGTCQGDSGGPVFADIDGRLQLIGTVVGGLGVQCGQLTELTRIERLMPFLQPFLN